MRFTDFDLAPALRRGIADLGFTEPTPIQQAAIPPGLGGRDILAAAMTGSGKTAGFVLPILQRLLAAPGRGTRALVLTPTRELAAQVHDHLTALARHTGITSAAIFGGVKPGPQLRALRSGVNVVIATPGRLLDHMGQGAVSFDRLEVVVLDEADRMLDMGFLPDVRRILSALPTRRQTMLFSATLPRPIVDLARTMLADPVRIDVERRSEPATGITHAVLPVPEGLKTALLIEVLRRDEPDTVLVFTRTKHRANRLSQQLERAGVSCDRIHGNRTQAQRERALSAFRNGRLQVLVATDIAARGIDVHDLPQVINFDVPAKAEDYIHRVGRTARARATGTALTFASPADESSVAVIERAVGRRLARRTLDGFDYAAAPGTRLEIPVGERIAAIRARRAEERARARAKAERRNGNGAAPRRAAGERQSAQPGGKRSAGHGPRRRRTRAA